jgi:hypothetical protein
VVKGNGSQLYQTMILKDETKYTVSGYIKASAANKKFGLILGSSNQYEIDYSYLDDEDRYPETMPREWVLPDTGWHYVQCTFWTPSSSNPDKKTTRRVGFTCEVPFEFWHAKLE